MKKLFLFFTFCLAGIFAYETSINVLYKSLDPKSIAKQLAFFELYPETAEGQKALKRAFALLNEKQAQKFALPKTDFSFLIKAVNNLEPTSELELSEEELSFINKLCSGFANRKLKTFASFQEADFLHSDPEQIDLSRALLVAQLGNSPAAQKQIRLYEAALDLMALQIKARIPNTANDSDKIKAISDFIFFEMGFAFPPHSTYSEEIDSFTYLPSVIDTKKGVCLGISILYFSLAQRLGLSLKFITPPGHIFLRYEPDNNPEKTYFNHGSNKPDYINIETTMRGVNIPDERYLGIELKKLPVRNTKEAIGFTFINAASIYLKEKKFDKALKLYEQAYKYLPDDPLTKELLGFCYIFLNQEKKGQKLLEESLGIKDEHHFSSHNLIKDFLEKKVSQKGIIEFFVPFEDKIQTLQSKKERLKAILNKYPEFRSGILLLASIYSEMGRQKDAYYMLRKYIKLEPDDPTIAFYLSEIALRRKNLNAAWHYFLKARQNFQKQGSEPAIIKNFYFNLKKTALN